MWKEHFKNLLGNSSKVTDKYITKIINRQIDIKLGQFTKEELNVVLTKIKSRRPAGLNKIPPKLWKARKFDLLCNKQNTKKRWTKGYILTFPKKGNFRITKNYKDITLTSIAVKVYNALFLNHVKREIKKIFREIDPQNNQLNSDNQLNHQRSSYK